MSIRFCVAAALAYGDLKEERFHHLRHPEVARLNALCVLEADPVLTQAFPAQQGARVEARLASGEVLIAALPDVVPATPEQIANGLVTSAGEILGMGAVALVEGLFGRLDHLPDADILLDAANTHRSPFATAPRRA
jgi:hypothetical protein